MWDTTRAAQRKHVLAQRDDVVGQPGSFARGIDPAHEPRVMGRDAGRAVVCMALLRLDAADRHHGLATDVDGVATDSEREERGLREAQLARSDKDNALMQA